MVKINLQPEWYSLSYHDRYLKLEEVRVKWCNRRYREKEDSQNRTICLNGTWINDISSFYLSLGEAVNGPNGYFGACLDALSDCLCGDFGVLPPLTIRLSHFDHVRKALDGQAWCRFRAECFQSIRDEGENIETIIDNGYLGDGSQDDISYWTAKYETALRGGSFSSDEFGSYFDAILEVFEYRGVQLIQDKE